MGKMIKKKLTLSEETLEWAKKAVKENLFPGIRSVSGLVEKALTELRENRSEKDFKAYLRCKKTSENCKACVFIKKCYEINHSPILLQILEEQELEDSKP